MKYIVHWTDGKDSLVEIEPWTAGDRLLDNCHAVMSWEDWYPEWKGNRLLGLGVYADEEGK